MKTLKEFLNQDANEKRQEKHQSFRQKSKDVLNRVKEKTAIARQKGNEMIAKSRQQSYDDIARMKEKKEQESNF